MAEVKKHLEASEIVGFRGFSMRQVVDMSWEGSIMGVLGKNGVVKATRRCLVFGHSLAQSVRFHPGDDKARQICVQS